MDSLINNWQINKRVEFKFEFKKSTFIEKQKLLNKINSTKHIEAIIEDLLKTDLSKMLSELEEAIFNIPNTSIENVLYQIMLFKYYDIYAQGDLCKKYIKIFYRKEEEKRIISLSIHYIFDLFGKNKPGKIILEMCNNLINNVFCWIRLTECYDLNLILNLLEKIQINEIFFLYIWCLYQNTIKEDYKIILEKLKQIYLKNFEKQKTNNFLEYLLKEIINDNFINKEFKETQMFLEDFFSKYFLELSTIQKCINVLDDKKLNSLVFTDKQYLIDHYIFLNILNESLIKKETMKILDFLKIFSEEMLKSYILEDFLKFLQKFLISLEIHIPLDITILEFILNIKDYKNLFKNPNQTIFYNIFIKNILNLDILEKDILNDIKKNKEILNLEDLCKKLIEREKIDTFFKKILKKYKLRNILISQLYFKILETIKGSSITKAVLYLNMFFFSLDLNKTPNNQTLSNRKKLLISLLENIVDIKVLLEKKIVPLIEIMKHLDNEEIKPFLCFVSNLEQKEENLTTYLLLKNFCMSRGICYEKIK